jgi:monofunctional biosynthetic peptidoglycan transglycosylase
MWDWIRGWSGAIWIEIVAFSRWFWFGHAGKRTPWVRRIFGVLFAFLVPIPIVLLLLFRIVPIPFTPQMVIGLVTLNPVKYSWRDDISPYLERAVIGSEDQNFCSHKGFDWDAIDKAIKKHERHPSRPLHGASTISQQTARTIFLTSNRSWIRKGIEAYLTVLIEALWPKKRIMTAYLNLVDWGHGNYGAEAAAEVYFGKSAAGLTRLEAARLAAILPNPNAWSATRPGPYARRRTNAIVGRIAMVANAGFDSCIKD